MKHYAVTLCIILGACNSTLWNFKGAETKGRDDQRIVPPTASRIARPTVQDPAPEEFLYRPTTAKETPREDLFRLIDATEAAYEALGFERPYPLIRIVGPNSPNLSGRHAMAQAMVTEDGKEIVYFNRDWLMSGQPLDGTVMHEYAHFETWRRYGYRVSSHGREFWSVCTSVTSPQNCKEYGERFG